MRATNEIKFQDVTLPTLEYKFTVPGKNPSRNVKIQTKEVETKSQEVNTKRAGRTVKLQVEDQQIQMAQRQKDEQDQDNLNINEQELGQFLKNVSPLMLSELDEHVFSLENYEPLWNNQQTENQIIYNLSNKSNKSYEITNQLDITSISWNSNGFVLAASYGQFHHQGACQHKSMVCLWNLNKRDFKQDTPTTVLDTDCCIVTIEFHPVKPSILVGGSFNGEIFLWDISREDEPLLSKSNIDDYFHREMVSQLIWWEHRVQGSNAINYNLLSISTDGKILLWEIKDDFNKNCLDFPLKGYSLVRKKDGAIAFVGGLCFAQTTSEQSTFIVGSETGSILRANLKNVHYDKRNKILLEQASSVKWKSSTTSFMLNLENKFLPDVKNQIEQGCRSRGINEIEMQNIFQAKPEMRKLYVNPISFAYEQHYGPVYSISFSPFYRNLFLTSSLDGSIKMFDVLSPKQLLSIEIQSAYIFKVEWSLTRPSVFIISLSNGEVRFYDFLKSNKSPIEIIENNDQQALNLRINKKQTDLIAVAYSKCQIRVIQLSTDITQPKKHEDVKFASYIDDIKLQQ